MGSACCVAARGKTIVSASGCEVLHHRNVRHYSPTWSFRWENRGRVAGEETSISWLSDGVSRNGGSDVKYESSAFASVDGSPMPDVCGRSPQFPRGLLCVQGLLLQLTDELGNPVKLTDELGNPVHITGVAIPQQAAAAPETGSIEAAVPEKGTDGTLLEALEAEEGRDLHGKDADENNKVIKEEGPDEVPQSTSSSSSSSEEDDGQGGRRRKKKGLKQKIKEKLTGRSSKQREEQHGTEIPTAGATKLSDDQDEKKSVMEKLKDLLPGHHSH